MFQEVARPAAMTLEACIAMVVMAAAPPDRAGRRQARESGYPDSSCRSDTDAGSTRSPDGLYALTSFGCWMAPAGQHLDPSDNCMPECGKRISTVAEQRRWDDTLQRQYSVGGIAAENRLKWFSTGVRRFGTGMTACGKLLKIANPVNGLSVIVTVIDKGPQCLVEQKAGRYVIDASVPVARCLFGTTGADGLGWKDGKTVIVTEAEPSAIPGPGPAVKVKGRMTNCLRPDLAGIEPYRSR